MEGCGIDIGGVSVIVFDFISVVFKVILLVFRGECFVIMMMMKVFVKSSVKVIIMDLVSIGVVVVALFVFGELLIMMIVVNNMRGVFFFVDVVCY